MERFSAALLCFARWQLAARSSSMNALCSGLDGDTMNRQRDKRLQERRARIGRRLRAARAKRLSQAELGRLVECSKSHVSQIESATGTSQLDA